MMKYATHVCSLMRVRKVTCFPLATHGELSRRCGYHGSSTRSLGWYWRGTSCWNRGPATVHVCMCVHRFN
uniref:Putative secreted protein n=1 Tax=Anopheles darlingi TaxID=43151 RepID=A0A2M4D729_ANODA